MRSKFKILEIRIHNFKGLKECSIDLSKHNLSILGGRNGFGKTTLFDAVELVLTGKIARYASYLVKKDSRVNYAQDRKPLVCDMSVPDVSVEIILETNGGVYGLRREALVENMTNPLSFEPFKILYVKRPNEDYMVCDDEMRHDILPSSVCNMFEFLHYIDQEEGTMFLKSKEKDRSEQVSKLFHVESLEHDIDKAKACKATLLKMLSSKSNEIKRLKEEIEKLKNFSQPQPNADAEYCRLLYAPQNWDKECPNLSFENYISLLGENGLLDDLAYYASHKEEYLKYVRNRYLADCLKDENLKSLAIYFMFSSEKAAISLYKEYEENIKPSIISIATATLKDFRIPKNDLLTAIVGSDTIAEIETIAKAIAAKYNSLKRLQREFTDVLDKRTSIAMSIESSVAFEQQRECPLCGQDYGSHDALLLQIISFGDTLSDYTKGELDDLQERVKLFREKCVTCIVKALEDYFASHGVTHEVAYSLDEKNATKIQTLKDKLHIRIERKETIEEQVGYMKTLFDSNIQEYDDSLNYETLIRIHKSYSIEISEEMFTTENIEKKRQYLIFKWNEKKVQMISEKEKEQELLQNIYNRISTHRKNIADLCNNMEEQRREYVNKLISDIEILFYIYSGRIMQDCYFGRGVFMKHIDNKRIMFVASDKDNEVDVLYNMSSGQLMSIVIAFTLALNKLYADCDFLAIDDPVQTIDDMNLWGFMETLRHEFHDHIVLMSTHEEQYGGLLRYKAEKLGMTAYFYDMKNVRENK